MNAVWLDGALLPAAAARIDPADRGFTLGDGIFETMLWAAGCVAHFARHMARLRNGAAVLGIPVPSTDDALHDACAALAGEMEEAALRLTLTRGAAPRGVLPPAMPRPTVLITVSPRPAMLPPARLLIARTTRRNAHSPLARIKSTNYLDAILARQEAAQAGFDDALLLNTDGDLAEATAANVVLRIDDRLVTPPVASGALPGIARGLLIERGDIVEARISLAEIRQARGGFLINALGRRDIADITGEDFSIRVPG